MAKNFTMNVNPYTEYFGTNPQFLHSEQPFALESGYVLPSLRICYHTYGTLSPSRDNVIWICHALTANSDVADWWQGTVVGGGVFDPAKYFVVCANKLGSCYGSTSPVDWQQPMDFPLVTIRDMVGAHQLLAQALGVEQIKLLIGGSTGGAQAMEWAIMEPERFGNLALTVTLPKCTPWITADNEAQRMALRADKTLYNNQAHGGGDGLMAARAFSMLIYRNAVAFNFTQRDDAEKLTDFRAASYQRYQGEKLSKRFDARSYYKMLDALDTHDVGRGRGGVGAALARIKARTVVMSVDTDIMFPAADVELFAGQIPGAIYHCIHSDFGHDGFLIETAQLAQILREHLL